MRRLLYLAAIIVTLGTSAQVLAQGGGFGGGGSGAGGGFGGGGAGGGGSSFGGGGSSFGGGGSSFGGGGTSLGGGGTTFGGGGTSFSGSGSLLGGTGGMLGGTTSTVPGRTGAGGRTIGGSGTQISSTNFLAATFANPLFPGRPGSSNTAPAAGGFGQPSFGNVTTTSNTRTAGAGRGAIGGTASVGSNYGRVTNTNLPIAFATELRFPAPPIQVPQVQADLQGLINRTSILKLPSAVRVEVSGNTVILRGRVADDDERRLIEGMVRLEPGIHDVRNELVVP